MRTGVRPARGRITADMQPHLWPLLSDVGNTGHERIIDGMKMGCTGSSGR